MPEDIKSPTRRFYAEMSAGNLGVIDELLADDFVDHEELPGDLPQDKQGVKQFFTMLRTAFPDMRMEVEDLIAEGDKVVARISMTATQQGEFMGVPPSGRSVDVQIIDVMRIRDGQAREHWGIIDGMALMQQLGAVPEAGPA